MSETSARTAWIRWSGLRLKLRLKISSLRYQLALVRLKLGHPRLRYHQMMIQYKLVLLYLLDKERALSVLRELNESSKQFSNRANGFNSSHKNEKVTPPNDHHQR